MSTAMLSVGPVPPTARRFTPDDLLKLEQHGLFELVNGELLEKPVMGLGAGKVAGILYRRLGDHVDRLGLGLAVFEVSFRSFPRRPDQVRRPGIAFIRTARLAGVPDDGHVPIAPDLAIEVVSPGDNVYELDEKLLDYASARVPLVWVINPSARLARVFRPGRPIDQLAETDALDGGDVVPGFSVVLRDLLPTAVGGA